jgi:hypothetical protein
MPETRSGPLLFLSCLLGRICDVLAPAVLLERFTGDQQWSALADDFRTLLVTPRPLGWTSDSGRIVANVLEHGF